MFKNIIKEQLKVPAHIDYLADLRDFTTRIGKKHGFSDRVINAFKLAIDEAGTNIVRHAYRDTGDEGFITIRAIVKKDSLTICLIDQGKYFDPKHVKDPDLQRYVDIGKTGGLGIFIMRRLMDEIDYRKTEEGNELRLTKLRDVPTNKRKLSIPLRSSIRAIKAIPLTFKAKAWLQTSIVFVLLTSLVYFYYFLEAKRLETAEFFNEIIAVSNLIIDNWQMNPCIIEDQSGIYARDTINKLYANEMVHKVIHEIVIVDSLGEIFGHIDHSKVLNKFEMPQSSVEVWQGIFTYSIPVENDKDGPTSKEVYDRIVPMSNKQVHFRAMKESLDQRIRFWRWKYARITVAMFIINCLGAFFLIHTLMDPFRKMADWVRTADHGDTEDDMDIDTSTEIGEIAQAFSEITNKFRESQQNLAKGERLQKEMQDAHEIQHALIPEKFPELEGYEIASYYEAAREIGGDYFDFIEVDKDTVGIAVADVSGKGVPGGIGMTMVRSVLRSEARGIKDAAEVLSRVNDFIMSDMKKGMFVTLFYLIIDNKHRRINYASAGHTPAILYCPSTEKTYFLNPRGFPVGIQLHDKNLFRKTIKSDTIQLAENDFLLIYTDGITEAMNARREQFGVKRLLGIIRDDKYRSANHFVEQIKEQILMFTEDFPQSDDIAMVAIREKAASENEELRRAKEAHNYKIETAFSIEAKQPAIEDEVKIYDIIKNHPEYSVRRISDELNTERYGFTVISESAIEEWLDRKRLNRPKFDEEKIRTYIERGETYYKNVEIEKALETFNHIIEIDPNNVAAYEKRANIYMNQQQYEKALKDYEYILQLDPTREVVRHEIESLSEQLKHTSEKT